MAEYNERPKGDVRPVSNDEKQKFQKNSAAQKSKGAGDFLSQDARRHAELEKHGKL